MRHMIGDDWKELFHVIVCLSKKPKFFESKHPFRRTSSRKPAFGEVKELLKGKFSFHTFEMSRLDLVP